MQLIDKKEFRAHVDRLDSMPTLPSLMAKLSEMVENPKYKEYGWTKKDVAKEMEYGAMTTQYWYNAMGMPEVFRSGAVRLISSAGTVSAQFKELEKRDLLRQSYIQTLLTSGARNWNEPCKPLPA